MSRVNLALATDAEVQNRFEELLASKDGQNWASQMLHNELLDWMEATPGAVEALDERERFELPAEIHLGNATTSSVGMRVQVMTVVRDGKMVVSKRRIPAGEKIGHGGGSA